MKRSGVIFLEFLNLYSLYIFDRSVPLNLLSVDVDDKILVDKTAILDEREKTFVLDTSKSFKLNSGSIGFCEYSSLIWPVASLF
jgi:hypothetical protein